MHMQSKIMNIISFVEIHCMKRCILESVLSLWHPNISILVFNILFTKKYEMWEEKTAWKKIRQKVKIIFYFSKSRGFLIHRPIYQIGTHGFKICITNKSRTISSSFRIIVITDRLGNYFLLARYI